MKVEETKDNIKYEHYFSKQSIYHFILGFIGGFIFKAIYFLDEIEIFGLILAISSVLVIEGIIYMEKGDLYKKRIKMNLFLALSGILIIYFIEIFWIIIFIFIFVFLIGVINGIRIIIEFKK
jgi:uncharacterized membrane protein (UPF0136 family)